MEKLFIDIRYIVKKGTCKIIGTNVQYRERFDFIDTFILTQIGRRASKAKARNKKIYMVFLEKNPVDGIYECRHNCGNQDIRDNILRKCVARL